MTSASDPFIVKTLPSPTLPVLLFFCTCYDPAVLSLPNYQALRDQVMLFHQGHANDMMAKCILRHDFGERLAILFRNWIRAQMDSSEELEDGGSGLDNYEEYLALPEGLSPEEFQDAA